MAGFYEDMVAIYQLCGGSSNLQASSLTTVINELSRETEGVLVEHLYKSLKGRKYLIVLDDVWKTQAWDDVKLLFPDDHNGSRIILTTRLVDVAVYANPSALFHQMQFLNKDASWNLLRQEVFAEECCSSELEEVGVFIARSCRGLPLSILVFAGLLSMAHRT
ncbi:putative late blight resistance protein homolog R1A-3 [Sesamum indicum]|uniref:Late blight resistance protein homolog R1A-3 n=1 Tax=Sesamum indicum TaxID=4182 RepID=A0A6I9SY66_SESIN|nr:putative late blight resistance protein homolog R1A-3 [Sesamum indicum]